MNLFRDSSEGECMNELEKLKHSELGAAAVDPIIEKHVEWLDIKAQLKTLEEKLLEVATARGKAVINYNRALYKLLLRKIQESGKAYCEYDNHVVSEVSAELTWNLNCNGYYFLNACSRCLKEIKAGEIVGGNRHVFYETKVEGGIRMRLKDGVWKPLPDDCHFYDSASEGYEGWLEDTLLKAYSLPREI
jgi:hypothetical protein